MTKLKQRICVGVAGALLLLGASRAASAATTNLTGMFSADNDIAWVDFSLTKDTLFSASTTSFGTGGFAPVLSLFLMDASKSLLGVVSGSSNSCGAPGAGAPSGGLCWDAFFSTDIGAGNYRLVISQDGNTPNGASLADGFSESSSPHYTGINYLGDSSLTFVNFDRTQRNGSYAVNLNVAATVPEPASAGMLLLGLVGVAGMAYRKKNQPSV
jgi:hypothetical protein